MPRMWLVSGAVLISLVMSGQAVNAGAKTPLDRNVTVNSGAEGGRGGGGRVVPIPLWKTTSKMTAVKYGTPGFPSKAVSADSFGEKNFFYCGRKTAASKAIQRVRLDGRDWAIDRGRLSLKTTVRIGSDTTDGDAGRMMVHYLDREGRIIDTLRTAWVEATDGLMPRLKTTGAIPKGTRALRVVLKGTGTAGTSCDVFFDNVSVKLVRSP